MLTRAAKRQRPTDQVEGSEERDEAADSCVVTMVLLSLPPSLLTLAQQCLSLEDKLAQLSHISRSFPPLTPASFACDCIVMTPTLRAMWQSSPRVQLLLSGVRSVQFQNMDVVHRPETTNRLGWAAMTVDVHSGCYNEEEYSWLSSPCPRSFPVVQQLALRMYTRLGDLGEDTLAAVFAVPQASYPDLRNLHLDLRLSDDYNTPELQLLRAPVFTPLLSLPTLHTLRLTEFHRMRRADILHWTAFRFLLTLPLTHLDLSNLTVDISVTAQRFLTGEESGDAASRPFTSTLKVLKLPTIVTAESSRAKVLAVLLQQHSERGSGTREGALEHVRVQTVSTQEEVACLARLSTVQSLELACSQQWIDLEPLYTTPPVTLVHDSALPRVVFTGAASTSSLHHPSASSFSAFQSPRPLPLLRHISVVNVNPDYRVKHIERDVIHSVRRNVDLVNCYAATLVCLHLSDIFVNNSCRPILQAVFSCNQLQRCMLRTKSRGDQRVGYPDVGIVATEAPSPLTLPPLPQLHTLTVQLLLTVDELAAVLNACFAVEDLNVDVRMDERRDVMTALEQLELVGKSCASVRRLTLHCGCSADEMEEKDESGAATSLPAAPSPCTDASAAVSNNSVLPRINVPRFNQLIWLTLMECVEVWCSATLRKLAAMLQAAPLQYLELSHSPYHLHHVHPLSSLTHLRVLSLSDGDMYTRNLDSAFIAPRSMRHSVSWDNSRREVVCERSIDGAITDEQLDLELSDAVRYGVVPGRFAGRLFVTDRIFDGGADGREAFFDSVRPQCDGQRWRGEEGSTVIEWLYVDDNSNQHAAERCKSRQ